MFQLIRDLFSGELFRRICAWNPGEKKKPKPSLSDLILEMGQQHQRTEQELVLIRGERDYLRGYLHYADWNDAARQAIDDVLKARAELAHMTKERDALAVELQQARHIIGLHQQAAIQHLGVKQAAWDQDIHPDDLYAAAVFALKPADASSSTREVVAELGDMTKQRDMWKANHDNQVKMKRSIEGANRVLIDERTELHRTYGIELAEWRAIVSKIAAAVPATCANLDDAVRVGDEVSTFLARVSKVQKQAARDQAYLYKLVNAEDGGALLGRFEEQTTEQVILTLNTLVAGVH